MPVVIIASINAANSYRKNIGFIMKKKLAKVRMYMIRRWGKNRLLDSK